jgi:hypothetical protein
VDSLAPNAPGTPLLRISRRRALMLVAAGGALVASLVFVVPSFADLPGTWVRVSHGDPRWLVFALGLEAVSFLGHIILFRAVGDDGRGRVGMRASTEITLAGHAATRLFASGGAGGVALTAWALRRSGMERADVAARMTTFLVLLYAVYMAALVLGGVGLFAGALLDAGHEVTSVERDLEASEDARATRAEWPDGGRWAAEAATIVDFLRADDREFDVVVADPPRAGLGAGLAGELARRARRLFLYVSCDPATLARDLVALRGTGLEIVRTRLYDLFAFTHRVEALVALERRS